MNKRQLKKMKIGFMRDGKIVNEIKAPKMSLGNEWALIDEVAIAIDELLHSTSILKENEEVMTFEEV